MKQVLESPLIAGTMPQCEVEMDGLFEFLHPKTTCDLVSCEHHFICSKYEGPQKGAILPISQSSFFPIKGYIDKVPLQKSKIFKPQNGVIDRVVEGIEGYSKNFRKGQKRLSDFKHSLEKIEDYEQSLCQDLEFEGGISDLERYSEIKNLQHFSADWPLVGSGEAHVYCGSFWKKTCLEDHPPIVLPDELPHQRGFDGKCMPDMAFIELHKMSCHRAMCPVCWEDWRSRQIASATKRFEAFEEVLNDREKNHLKKCHTMMSPPKRLWGLPQKKLQKLVYRYLKELGIDGGTCVFHSKRFKKNRMKYFSPHFHPYVYLWNGWIDGKKVDEWSKRTGWVFKNFGERPLAKSLSYQLGHAGVPPKRGHVLKWFGNMSYNKFHVEKFHGDISHCPWGHPMDKFGVFIGSPKDAPVFPDEDGFTALVPKDGWVYLPKGGTKKRNKENFDEEY